MISKIPLIALIGLPNSGKSTLVNKLTGTKVAIESKEAHTTRDLNYGEDFWDGYYLRFVDTGGLVPDPEDKIQSAVQMKSWNAISDSDLLIWVIDRKKEPETISQKIIQKVWKSGKPFIVCINKVDDPNLERDISEYAFLGSDGFANVSCNTGYGTDKLMTQITDQLEKLGFEQNFETDIDLTFRKPKRQKTKDVKLSKDGSYYIIRNDEGVFQSVDEQNLDNELEGKKPKEVDEVEIKNIVVDLGGVVFQFRYQQMINYLKEHFDLKKDLQFTHESYWSDTFKNWEIFEKLDFWNKLVKGLKIEKETTAKQLKAIFFAFDGVNHKNVDFLCEQKLAGKKIFWLSNASKSDILIREKLEFWKIFDGGLDSFECGLSKPDPEIYKRLLNKYNLKPHESFYVDDLKENFHTAMKLGFKSVHYKEGETNLEQEIAQVEDKNFRLPKVLFLGRPNVGKSSLFNAMAQKDLQIVTDIAGTTMSINDTLVEKNVEKIYEFSNLSGSKGMALPSQSSQVKHLIFDFDGVLGDTFKEAVETNQTVFKVDEDTAKQTIRSHFSKVSNAFKNDHIESKPIKEKRDNDEFFKLLTINCVEKSTLFEDFLQEISTLENAKLAIVSGGSKDYILPLLGDYAGMFDFILDYQDSLSKEEKVESVCKNWGINEKEVYYFTDTQTDVLELDKYMDKTRVIGCSWGFQGYKALTEVLPKNQILKEFSDIHKLFENLKQETIKPQLEKVKIKTSKPYILLDSVGIRQAGKRTFGIESFATYRTIQAANEADVICLVVDGSQNLSHQDQVVAGIAKEAKKGIVVIVNKADLVDPKERKKFIDEFEYKFGFLHVEGFIWVSAQKAFERNVNLEETQFSKIQLSNAPIKEAPKEKKKDKRRGFGTKEMFINSGSNDIADTSQIWEMIDKCLLERSKEIKKEDLRKIFNYIVKRKPPQKLRTEKKAILYDLLYVKSTPPTFHLLVKDRDSIHWSFTRFLENILRDNFGFKNTEIKVKLVEVERKKVLSY